MYKHDLDPRLIGEIDQDGDFYISLHEEGRDPIHVCIVFARPMHKDDLGWIPNAFRLEPVVVNQLPLLNDLR